MAYIKNTWENGDVITAEKLNHMEDGIAASDMSDDVKTALLQLASKVAYIDDDGQDYYDDLYAALYDTTWAVTNTLTHCSSSNSAASVEKNGSYSATITASAGYTLTGATVSITMGGTDITSTAYSNGTISIASVTGALVISVTAAAKTVSSISAVYTQSGTVYDTDSLDSLKADLVVTATYSDTTTETVPSADYTLSGTLTIGTATITVTFAEVTTTFTVTVTEYRGIPANYTWLYDARSGETLSEQSYVTKTTSGTTSETLSDNILVLHCNNNGTASGTTNVLLTFAFTDTTTMDAVLTTRAKIVNTADISIGTAGLGQALCLSNGSTGALVFIEQKNNQTISIDYYEGSTRKIVDTNFSLSDYHIFELKLHSGTQTFSIDGTQIFQTSTLSSSYSTVNRIRLQATGSERFPNGVTTNIDWMTYYEVA